MSKMLWGALFICLVELIQRSWTVRTSLEFLSKKSWHTGTLRNQEKVWLAQQKKEAEEKKQAESEKTRAKEREFEDYKKMQGLGPPPGSIQEWMYPTYDPSQQDYAMDSVRQESTEKKSGHVAVLEDLTQKLMEMDREEKSKHRVQSAWSDDQDMDELSPSDLWRQAAPDSVRHRRADVDQLRPTLRRRGGEQPQREKPLRRSEMQRRANREQARVEGMGARYRARAQYRGAGREGGYEREPTTSGYGAERGRGVWRDQWPRQQRPGEDTTPAGRGHIRDTREVYQDQWAGGRVRWERRGDSRSDWDRGEGMGRRRDERLGWERSGMENGSRGDLRTDWEVRLRSGGDRSDDSFGWKMSREERREGAQGRDGGEERRRTRTTER